MAAAIGLATAPRYPLAFRMVFGLVPCRRFCWPDSPRTDVRTPGFWFVPAVYVGVAMAAETAAASAAAPVDAPALGPARGRAVAVSLWMALAADSTSGERSYIALRALLKSKRITNSMIAPLSPGWVRQRHPGDVWMAPHLTLPAIWWYAGAATRVTSLKPSRRRSKAASASRRRARPRRLGEEQRRAPPRARCLALVSVPTCRRTSSDTLISAPDDASEASRATARFCTGHALIVDFQTPPTGPIAPTR